MVNQLFTDGYGRLTLDRYAFRDHVAGTLFRHNASGIDVSPSLVINDITVTNVQDALAATNDELNILELSGKGFITVGDGYDTYHFSNPSDPAYVSINPDPAYDAAVPAFNTYLNNLLNISDPNDPDYNPLHARIRDGGIVLIKAGTYKFTDTVTIPAGMIIMGENYGTKIVNQMASPAPLFKSQAAINRIPDTGVDVINKFMFNRDSALVNLTIADNFLVPKFTGDPSYLTPINNDSIMSLVSVEGGSSLICENVKFVGKTVYSLGIITNITSFAIKLNNTVTTGTFLKINNCFIDGFAQPISFNSTGGRNDYLEVTNSRIRSHGNLGLPASSDPATIFGADLVHLWDSYDGTTLVDSVGGLHGTPQTNAPVQATVNGHTYPVFDGIDTGMENAATDTVMDNLSSWTFFWAFKTNAGAAFGAIIDHAQQYYMELNNGSGSAFVAIQGVGNPDLIGVTSMEDDQWHRCIVSVNSLAAELYIDGYLDATCTFINALPSAVNPTLFGVQPGGTVTDSSIAIIGAATRGMTGSEIALLDGYLATYVSAPITTEEANCIIHINDNNAMINNNEFYGNHDTLTTLCYIKNKIVVPAAQDKSHIIINANTFTIGKGGGTVIQGNPFVIDAGIIGTFNSNAFIMFNGNLTGSGYAVGTNVSGASELTVNATGIELNTNNITLDGSTAIITISPNLTLNLTTSTTTVTGTISNNANYIVLNGALSTTQIVAVSSGPYTVDVTNSSLPDYMLLVDTLSVAITINLPVHVAGRTLIIKDSGGNSSVNNITLVRNGGTGNIDDFAGDRTISTNWASLTLISDSANWLII